MSPKRFFSYMESDAYAPGVFLPHAWTESRGLGCTNAIPLAVAIRVLRD